MKILKVIGIIFGLLIAAAAGVWFFLLRAPSTEDQCAHVLSLMEAKTPGIAESPIGQEMKDACPDKMKKGMLQGQGPYAKQAKCVMAASSLEDLDACNSR